LLLKTNYNLEFGSSKENTVTHQEHVSSKYPIGPARVQPSPSRSHPIHFSSYSLHSSLFSPNPAAHVSPPPKTPTAAGGHAPPPPPPPSPTTPSLHPHLHIYPPPSLAFSAPPLPLAPLLSTLPPSGRRD